jgi:hypothetical protein
VLEIYNLRRLLNRAYLCKMGKWKYYVSFVLLALCCRPASAQSDHTLLYWGELLESHIDAQHTTYRHKDNIVTWGDDGSPYSCYADCSGFINALIGKVNHWTTSDFETYFGHKRMYAYQYFDAISAENHFKRISNINDIQPGDLIALKYTDRSAHDDNTGHIMLIASTPKTHNPSKILEPNTLQYEIQVIDCTTSPHGKTDSRFNPAGEYPGLGEGAFRLYTDEQGNITAYSWSTGNPKAGFDPYANPVIVGRFIP